MNDQQRENRFVRLGTIGEMLSPLAHDVNNNLTIISLYANKLKKTLRDNDLLDDKLNEAVSLINESIQASAAILSGLSSYSKYDFEEDDSISIVDLIDQVLVWLYPIYKREDVTIEKNYQAKKIVVSGQFNELQQLIIIPCVFLRESMIKPGGKILIETLNIDNMIQIKFTGFEYNEDKIILKKDLDNERKLKSIECITKSLGGSYQLDQEQECGHFLTISIPVK